MIGYKRCDIEGWTVQVRRDFLHRHAASSAMTLKLLGNHLFHATRVIPRPALRKLRHVTIWVERDTSRTSRAP
jgi:hypothetical protein